MPHSAEIHLRPLKPGAWEPTLPDIRWLQEQMGDFPPARLGQGGLTCGTHLGETKLVASITGSPASESMSISLIFTGVGTIACSGQKPRIESQHPQWGKLAVAARQPLSTGFGYTSPSPTSDTKASSLTGSPSSATCVSGMDGCSPEVFISTQKHPFLPLRPFHSPVC